MENILTRNVFMAYGAWLVALFDYIQPSWPLWKVAAGITLGGALYCLMAWSKRDRLSC